nr:unnamed protein product [Callosobruchus analis]
MKFESEMSCSGDELLEVFKTLKINLSNIKPDVIRAWFDTDDEKMKNLLEWLCTSLSVKNYISPLEYDEFLKLENQLKDEIYEREVERIEIEHPNLFSVEDTELEIKLLENELECLREEETFLDQALDSNRSFQETLSSKLNKKSSLEIKTSVKLKLAQDKTDELAKELDAINININSQLVKYGHYVNDFRYGTQQNWMSVENDNCQENVDLLSSSLKPILVRPADETSVFMDSTSWYGENSRKDIQFDSLKQRLYQSKLNHVVGKTALETTKKIFEYLLAMKFESFMALGLMEKAMYSMLENTILNMSEKQVSNSKLRYLQSTLANFQNQLKTIADLEDLTALLLSHYHLLLIINTLQHCENRIEKMKSVIKQYEAEQPDDKFRFIKHVINIVFGEESDIKNSLQTILYLLDTEKDLGYQLFSPDFIEERSSTLEMENYVKTLRSFLVPGPTSDVVLLPVELQKMVFSVEDRLEKQSKCVRAAVAIFPSRRKLNKWENHRRLLWTYFYTNPQKLLLVLQEIENELPKMNSTSKSTLIE